MTFPCKHVPPTVVTNAAAFKDHFLAFRILAEGHPVWPTAGLQHDGGFIFQLLGKSGFCLAVEAEVGEAVQAFSHREPF